MLRDGKDERNSPSFWHYYRISLIHPFPPFLYQIRNTDFISRNWDTFSNFEANFLGTYLPPISVPSVAHGPLY